MSAAQLAQVAAERAAWLALLAFERYEKTHAEARDPGTPRRLRSVLRHSARMALTEAQQCADEATTMGLLALGVS